MDIGITEMVVTTLQDLSLEQLRQQYRFYLNGQNYSKLTITTALYDSFYLFNHEGHDAFWNSVLSPNFEEDARAAIHAALTKHSSVNPDTQVSAYMSHLRRFRKYAFSTTSEEQFSYVQQGLRQDRERRQGEKKEQSPRSSKSQLPRPSASQVDHYLDKWNGREDYSLQEDALDKLFFHLCPENTCIEDILLKVSTLNDFYSTQIFSTFPVAKHILGLGIDEKLRDGTLSVVEAIQKVNMNGTERNFYSFATKYCSHHNPLAFPIYDDYVGKVLYQFMKQDHFISFKQSDLKDYQKFYNVLLGFRSFYGLEKYSLKEIDKYLWQLGKTYYPKSYSKKGRPNDDLVERVSG